MFPRSILIIVTASPGMFDGATVIPVMAFGFFLLIKADLDGLFVLFEAVGSMPFELFVDDSCPDALVFLIIPEFA